MHILILSWRDIKNPLSGGAESFLHELSKRIIKKGHKVTLFSSSFSNAKSKETIDGVTIYRKGNPWTVHLQAFLWYKKKPKNAFDLIIDNFHAIPFFTPLYASEPVIGMIHEVANELWFAETFFPASLIGYLTEPLFFLFYRRQHFIVASSSTTQDLTKMGHSKEKITEFFQGIDMKPVNKIPRKTKFPLLISLSRLSPTKRIEHTILAHSQVTKKIPNAQLWIAGSGKQNYLNKLKKLVKKLKLQNNIKFIGHISGKQKINLLKKAWIIVGASIREGWGLAITEAAAFGTPAVTYDIPGFRNSIQHNKTGILITTQSPEALAKNITKLIRNHKKRNRLAKNAIRSAKGRTRSKTVNQLLPLMLQISGEKKLLPTKRLHILIISWRDLKSPAAGGAEILTHEIARRLVDSNHKVTILSPVFPGASNEEVVNGVTILRPSFFYATHLIAYLNWPRFLLNAAAIYRSQLSNSVDIVIDQVHGLPSFTPLYINKPIILFPLEVADNIWLTEIPFPGNIVGWFIERVYLRLFRKLPFITISPSTAKDLHHHGIKKVKVITPGVATPPKSTPKKAQVPTFICLGRITKMKRLEDTILAFAKILQYHPNSQLHIVGKGSKEYQDQLTQLASDLNILNNVTFHGFVPEKRKYELLSQSWALLSTSLREGWGLNVIEATSVGTPTIAYNVPGISDSVISNKTGILTKTNTPEKLAALMRKFITQKSLRKTLSKKSKVHSKQFTWDKTTDQFLKAVQNNLTI
jgi:glycosyltransferase involved in cell wall biosynthesis